MTDPISDFLTRLRNASRARRPECVSPHSGMRAEIARILHEEGYTEGFELATDEAGHKTIVVKLKYVDGTPALSDLLRVSTPGCRLYYGYRDIPRVLNGLGIAIISTSRGLMKDSDARRQKVGGELVCNIW